MVFLPKSVVCGCRGIVLNQGMESTMFIALARQLSCSNAMCQRERKKVRDEFWKEREESRASGKCKIY